MNNTQLTNLLRKLSSGKEKILFLIQGHLKGAHALYEAFAGDLPTATPCGVEGPKIPYLGDVVRYEKDGEDSEPALCSYLNARIINYKPAFVGSSKAAGLEELLSNVGNFALPAIRAIWCKGDSDCIDRVRSIVGVNGYTSIYNIKIVEYASSMPPNQPDQEQIVMSETNWNYTVWNHLAARVLDEQALVSVSKRLSLLTKNSVSSLDERFAAKCNALLLFLLTGVSATLQGM